MKPPSAEVLALSQLIGKSVVISFSCHAFPAVLQSVELQKLTGMTNAPEKRVGPDGKGYTPKCLRLMFDVGAIVVVLEDCQLVAVMDGFCFVFPTYRLEVRYADSHCA
jgi:hypothetical protein